MSQFDVCVIGAGPGGYVAAIRCAQLGLKTAVVEREKLGGVCLNVGCIPSKAMISAASMLHRMQHDASEMGLEFSGNVKVNMPKLKSWKQSVCDRMSGGVEQLLKGNGVDIIAGEAEFTSPTQLKVKGSDSTKSIEAKNFIVATGSRPIEIPGFAYDEKTVLSSTGALDLDKMPKSVVVIGGGYIGLEIGGYLAKLGAEVDVLEANDALLKGVAEKDVVQVVAKNLKKHGVKVHLKAMAKEYKKSGSGVEVKAEVNGESKTFKAEKILVTVGRKPNSDQMNLKGIGLNIDERGFIKTDAQRRTSHPNIFAIGDIACQPMLAHKASHEGVMVAEIIAGQNRVYDAKTVPAVIFTDPEIASAGLLESEAKDRGFTDLKIAKFPFAANGKAVSLMETDGFVKMIADAKTNVVLGVHIVGPEASNLISEAALAIEMGATLEDIALTIHPHPTLGETMMEAAEATLGHAIHVIQKLESKMLPEIEDWGLISYQEAFEKQKQYVEEVLNGDRADTLVFCHHPPVVTLGRGTKPEDVFAWQGETVEVNRGGRATYHGPNQVVMYPIVDLSEESRLKKKLKPKDLHEYMRILEEAAIMTIKDYQVDAEGHSLQKQVGEDKEAEATGVWVGNRKMASIGIAVKKWVTSHGIAINLLKDEQAFQGINPCGFKTETMVSLKELSAKRPKREEFQKELASNFIYLMYLK